MGEPPIAWVRLLMGLLFLLLVLGVLLVDVIVLALLLIWVADNNNAVSLLRAVGGLAGGSKEDASSTGNSRTWELRGNGARAEAGDALWGEQAV